MSQRSRNKREPLHVWLRHLIDSSTCPGVRWEDKNNGIFRIPWLNQKTQEWCEENSRIFLEYAIHTGKYKPGEKKDFPKFKQNLKSALEKNRFVERDRTRVSKTYRLYKLQNFSKQTKQVMRLPNVEHESQGLSAGQSVAKDDSTSVLDITIPDDLSNSPLSYVRCLFLQDNVSAPHLEGLFTTTDNSKTQDLSPLPKMLTNSGEWENEVPRTISTENNNVDQILQNLAFTAKQYEPDDLSNSPSSSGKCCLPLLDNLAPDALTETACDDQTETTISMMEENPACSMDLPEEQDMPEKQRSLDTKENLELNTAMSLQEPSIIPVVKSDMTKEQDPDLIHIQVIYGTPERTVLNKKMKTPKCRIFFGKTNNKQLQKEIDDKDPDAVQIEFPSVEENVNFNDKSKKKIQDVLENMELGVVISYKNDDIYVVRRCKSRVFLSDGTSTSEPLPRSHMHDTDIEIKVFDNERFLNSVRNYEEKKTSVDKYYFYLTFGYTIKTNSPSPTGFLPVFIRVEHLKAASKSTKLFPSSGPEYSLSDSFDHCLSISSFSPCSSFESMAESSLMSIQEDCQLETIVVNDIV